MAGGFGEAGAEALNMKWLGRLERWGLKALGGIRKGAVAARGKTPTVLGGAGDVLHHVASHRKFYGAAAAGIGAGIGMYRGVRQAHPLNMLGTAMGDPHATRDIAFTGANVLVRGALGVSIGAGYQDAYYANLAQVRNQQMERRGLSGGSIDTSIDGSLVFGMYNNRMNY